MSRSDPLRVYDWLRPLFFTMEPERAHQLVYTALATASRFPPFLAALERRHAWHDPLLSQELWGLQFDGPVGLAAGFDKDARAIPALAALGFHYVEVGTVTPRPQPGNPQPRLFRLPADGALVNRMGFNNEGMDAMAHRLEAWRRRVSAGGGSAGIGVPAAAAVPIGVNLGKNRDTPVERAAEDYLAGMRRLYGLADYLVVNVSSPNTPGLRLLQDADSLRDLLTALLQEGQDLALQRGLTPRPLLVKLAPDLSPAELEASVGAALDAGVSGIVATNTTSSREGLRSAAVPPDGGLSGRPLRSRANAMVAAIRRLVGPKLPIVGVGGIFTGADAYERIRSGASLVQVYTGFIYRGPTLASDVARQLGLLLRRDGIDRITDAVGVDVR